MNLDNYSFISDKSIIKLDKTTIEQIEIIEVCLIDDNTENCDIGIKFDNGQLFEQCVKYAYVNFNNKKLPLYFISDNSINSIKMFIIEDIDNFCLYECVLPYNYEDGDDGTEIIYIELLNKIYNFAAVDIELSLDDIENIEILKYYSNSTEQSGITSLIGRIVDVKIADIKYNNEMYSLFLVAYDGLFSIIESSYVFIKKYNSDLYKKYYTDSYYSRINKSNCGDYKVYDKLVEKIQNFKKINN